MYIYRGGGGGSAGSQRIRLAPANRTMSRARVRVRVNLRLLGSEPYRTKFFPDTAGVHTGRRTRRRRIRLAPAFAGFGTQ